ncbi:MAG: 3-deoxy-manno-octulosonate cytidylyltransferase [Desulfobacteraceae bacterium]|nr:MAG: 3-deoxy-manno-octulosonate cytidylyltransferase [Desulfobacteraceae bacterium]
MTTAIIPSRWGSSRFEGKPLALVNNRPMIQRVTELARQSRTITRAVVATDDDRIFQAVADFGGQAVMTETDLRSGTDRVARTAELLEIPGDEIVVNIQGDQPFFNPELLDELIQPFQEDKDLLMSTLAFRITDQREITNPNDVKVCFDRNGWALYFSRAQIPFPRDGQTDVDYFKHLGFYAYKMDFLTTLAGLPAGRYEQIEKLEQLRVIENGYAIKVVVTGHDSPEVDLPEDIPRIEQKLSGGHFTVHR